jgi:hypothetical protein
MAPPEYCTETGSFKTGHDMRAATTPSVDVYMLMVVVFSLARRGVLPDHLQESKGIAARILECDWTVPLFTLCEELFQRYGGEGAEVESEVGNLLNFLQKGLKQNPARRATAKELLQHDFLAAEAPSFEADLLEDQLRWEVQRAKMTAALFDFSGTCSEPAAAAAPCNELVMLKQHSSSINSCSSCNPQCSPSNSSTISSTFSTTSHGEAVEGPETPSAGSANPSFCIRGSSSGDEEAPRTSRLSSSSCSSLEGSVEISEEGTDTSSSSLSEQESLTSSPSLPLPVGSLPVSLPSELACCTAVGVVAVGDCAANNTDAADRGDALECSVAAAETAADVVVPTTSTESTQTDWNPAPFPVQLAMALVVSSLPAAAAAPNLLAAAGDLDAPSVTSGMGAIVASAAAAPTSHAVQLVRKSRGLMKVVKKVFRVFKVLQHSSPAAQPYQQAIMQVNVAA